MVRTEATEHVALAAPVSSVDVAVQVLTVEARRALVACAGSPTVALVTNVSVARTTEGLGCLCVARLVT